MSVDRVGVVIPCKNEGTTIRRCLTSLRAQTLTPERIVVVDNGSTDGSLEIARELADEVLEIAGGSISGLRNAGAARLGDVDAIAFIDADMELGQEWMRTCARHLEAGAGVVGSRNAADPQDTWVARRWAALEAATTHEGSRIWSQSLLIDRALFESIGGFNETLPTGEDVRLSDDVAATGRPVVIDPELHAVHHGFPSTLRGFAKRELWHTRHHGWFGRMSPKSRVLVAGVGGWAVLGAASAATALTGRPLPLLGWVAGTAAAVPALGAVAGAGGGAQDGALLGFWAGLRASRLPREAMHLVRAGSEVH